MRGFNRKNAHRINYPNLSSAIRPTEDEDLILNIEAAKSNSDTNDNCTTESEDDNYEDNLDNNKINQAQLDYFIRELNLSKEKSCLAGSLLKDFGVLERGTKISIYRNRDKKFVDFFSRDDNFKLVYCCNLSGLLQCLEIKSNIVQDWWLFIDSSSSSIKAVLMHVNNDYPAIPLAYSRECKETYVVIKTILELINYKEFQWSVGGDLKMVGLLTGLQNGYIKHG